MAFYTTSQDTDPWLCDPAHTREPPVSPYLDSDHTTASQPPPVHRPWTGATKSGSGLHSVYRVDSDDALTQVASRRRKMFSWMRNPTDPSQYKTPTEYQKVEQGQALTAREYHRRRQQIRILLNSSSRLLLTVLLCGMCALVLKRYEDKGNLTSGQSQWLNALMTALPLFIGLNYRSSLQSYARILRWWILARWDWKLRHFDLILDAASSKAIIKLFWSSRRRIRSYIPTMTQLACIAWLAINLTGAIGIALLSLTYQLEQSQAILMKNGNVSILDVGNETAWQEIAYYYGSGAAPVLLFPYATLNGRTNLVGLNSSTEALTRPARCRICTSWEYAFQDWDPKSDLKGQSERWVTANATCKGYPALNYTTDSIIYTDANNETSTWSVPWVGEPWSANKTFWQVGTGASYVHDSKADCGPRCARMYIISTQNWKNKPVWLYNCTNTVGQIEGKNLYAPLSDVSARALAASSASYRNSTDGIWTNNVQYDWSNAWVITPSVKTRPNDENRPNDEVFAAASLAQFSMTAIASVDHIEEEQSWIPPEVVTRKQLRKSVPGKKPYQALKLAITWAYAIAILCAVPGLQLVVLLSIVFFANDVVVKDESHLNTARLLAPVAQRMSHCGSLLQVEEVVESMGEPSARYRYGWDERDGIMRVGVIERLVGLVVGRKERKFTEGFSNPFTYFNNPIFNAGFLNSDFHNLYVTCSAPQPDPDAMIDPTPSLDEDPDRPCGSVTIQTLNNHRTHICDAYATEEMARES
ncbi:hypothetical protein EK21DRAFT_115525 [Setomelanomma holmii]|uniref:Uncharacterized protein n=1 Tax=Setomelanomma holmii TaxID=210430 RepID=A0A9P4H3P7_9PLEO|nr:hypothetical protein EK21DRAFT_115525 [Setomelanomma holmii]